jgi:hypothetical protein
MYVFCLATHGFGDVVRGVPVDFQLLWWNHNRPIPDINQRNLVKVAVDKRVARVC